jgi:YkoY family integral membrane protein
MFGQTFTPGDLATIAMLVLLEGLLSLDNALVLGVLSQRVEPGLRRKALSYGLIGALALRIFAVAAALYLLRFQWLKLAGALYLMWISFSHFVFGAKKRKVPEDTANPISLGRVILQIELMDLAFAVDSVLAAVALVGPAPAGSGAIHPKLWVIITGGMLGVILMRFAAALFAQLLDRFRRLNTCAYLLVLLIAVKLVLDWHFNIPGHPGRLDFSSPKSPAMWIFWGAALSVLVFGFFRQGD